MTRLVRKRGSVAASWWANGVITLFGALAIAPASAAERVRGQVPGAGAPITIE
jgi:hypothetical protein